MRFSNCPRCGRDNTAHITRFAGIRILQCVRCGWLMRFL
jgi:Zn ribbon nucleic-acid-binding protein